MKQVVSIDGKTNADIARLIGYNTVIERMRLLYYHYRVQIAYMYYKG